MKISIAWFVPVLVILGSLPAALEAAEVNDSRLYVHPESRLRVVGGVLSLPSHGLWQPDPNLPVEGPFRQIALVPPEEFAQARMGHRAREIKRQRELRQCRVAAHAFWWPLLRHGRRHDGELPGSLEELDLSDHKRASEILARGAAGTAAELKPPYYALLQGVSLEFPADRDGERAFPVNEDPMVVELHPIHDDGKHFVLFTNGRLRREDIDRERLAAQGLAVTPMSRPQREESGPPAVLDYSVYALHFGPEEEMTFQIKNTLTGEGIDCRWRLTDAAAGGKDLGQSWVRAYTSGWARMAQEYDSPVLHYWLWTLGDMFGEDLSVAPRRGRRERRDVNTTDMFNVMGGRAAMRETLQLQALQMSEPGDGQKPPVPIASIAGVEVKSHPFEEMLAGKPGGRLPIADVVPLDRFMVAVAKPEALMPLLDEGASFIGRAGAAAVGRSLDYQLERRYLERLGMTREWLNQLIEAGAISELAVFLPDLFVIDGTDITAIARVRDADLFRPLLAMMGAGKIGGDGVKPVTNAHGYTAYWASAGDLFFVGTNGDEVRMALDLARKDGQGSLGRSAEFRYMLTQLPLSEQTRVYAYFSDAFIRRLVGPKVKIGQLRRIQESARLQAVTSAALLWKSHEQPGRPTVEKLLNAGYLPGELGLTDITLDADDVAVSEEYGSLGKLATLPDVPIDSATAAEADAYKAYVTNYSRFWRRFFDPIAVRLDEVDGESLEMTTFILPLIDNSLYNGLKQIVGSDGGGAPMRLPVIEPSPVAMFSIQLSEKVWVDFLGEFLGKNPAFDAGIFSALDDLGPAVHVAVHDSNPIIAFGSGEMIGFGGDIGGLGDDMLAIPLIISLLTRPTTLAVELRQEEAVREFLSSGTLAALMPFRGMAQVGFYQIKDADAWIYSVSFAGISLRYQFEIRDGYLLLRNMPWGPDLSLSADAQPPVERIRLLINPQGAEKQLAAMFTAAKERERRLAMEGIAYLEPFVETGLAVSEALVEHRRLLGFAPAHPRMGTWRRQGGRLESDVYGTPGAEVQPPYRKGVTAFGVLQGVKGLEVGMRFEDDGLRARVKWQYQAPAR